MYFYSRSHRFFKKLIISVTFSPLSSKAHNKKSYLFINIFYVTFSFVGLCSIPCDCLKVLFFIMAMNWYLSVRSLRCVLVLTSKHLTFKWVLMQTTCAGFLGNTILSTAVTLTVTAGHLSGCCAVNRRGMDHSKEGLKVKRDQNTLKNHF